MKRLASICFVMALLAGCATTESDSAWPGYRTDARGELLRDHRGHCWRTADWRPHDAVPECDGALAGPQELVMQPVATPSSDAETDAYADAAPPAPVTATVYFGFNQASLDAAAQRALLEALLALPQIDDTLNVALVGHADAQGDPDYNLALSRRRAEAVRDALIAHGVPASVITLKARGDQEARRAEAVCPGPDQLACWRYARRVQITVQVSPSGG